MAADHLSRLKDPDREDLKEETIEDYFPHETLLNAQSKDEEHPWFADIANYLAGGVLRKDLTFQ